MTRRLRPQELLVQVLGKFSVSIHENDDLDPEVGKDRIYPAIVYTEIPGDFIRTLEASYLSRGRFRVDVRSKDPKESRSVVQLVWKYFKNLDRVEDISGLASRFEDEFGYYGVSFDLGIRR